jgi:hypothetical protein
MTWLELKKYISKMGEEFLKSQVKMYDYSNGEEYLAEITELLINEKDDYDENDGWVPYICINEKEVQDEPETKKASSDRFS